jgi:hypothetical protein
MSDTESESENEITLDPFELFVFNESDSIIDLHEDLKNRVPYFFKNTSIPLYNFILDHIFFISKHKNVSVAVNDYFINEYNKEIQVTLDTVNYFLVNNRKKSLKCGSIKLKDWQVFCYENFL